MRLFSEHKAQSGAPALPPKYDWPKKPVEQNILLTKSQGFLDGTQDIFDLLAAQTKR